jgi:hypothetical protein
MAPLKSVCGLDLPLGDNFDFVAWRKIPRDMDIPNDMMLQERNQYNYDAEMHNRASISTTRAYEMSLKQGFSTTAKDVGAKLRAYYRYEEDEMQKMVDDPELCTHVLAPIPPTLYAFILDARRTKTKAEEAKKEAEKQAKDKPSKLAGTMIMSNVTHINALTRPPVSIPPLFLAALKYKMHPSIFWFSDDRLRFATEHPGKLPTKKNTSIASGNDKSLLDCTAMEKIWGSDDACDGVSVLGWVESFGNFLDALKELCAPPTDENPFSYALEMKKHYDFFRALKDFEKDFAIWYPGSPSSQSPAELIGQALPLTVGLDPAIPSTDSHPSPDATENANRNADDACAQPSPLENTNANIGGSSTTLTAAQVCISLLNTSLESYSFQASGICESAVSFCFSFLHLVTHAYVLTVMWHLGRLLVHRHVAKLQVYEF